MNGSIDDIVNILSNGVTSESYDYDVLEFFQNNQPSKVILNSNEQTYNKNADYLQVTLNKNGLNKIEVIWNGTLTDLEGMFFDCKSLLSVDFTNFNFS